MKRWHEETVHMRREWKIEMGIHGYDWRCPPTDPSACHCVTGIGFFRKGKAHDCGNPRCWLCHSEKMLSSERRKRRAAGKKEIEAQLLDCDSREEIAAQLRDEL